MRNYSLVTVLLILLPGYSNIFSQSLQTQDTIPDKPSGKSVWKKIYEYFENSNEIDTNKNFDVSFIGGPHYSKDTKLGLGFAASGLYFMDKEDPSLSPSNVSLYGDITTSGFYMLGISGNTVFPENKYRIDVDMYFSSMPGKYWGVGYERGNKKDNYTKYTKKEIEFKVDLLKKVARNTYFGITAMAQNIHGVKVKDMSYLAGEDKNNNAIGGGLILSYDSRDFIPNPYKGIYFKIEQNFYPEFLGSTHYFNRTEVAFRYYQKVWHGGILAYDLQGIFNNGDVPWSMLALVGSSYKMRGYFKGQYRDKKLMQTQLELRQKLYGRSGIALWAGAGNAFHDFDSFKWRQTLPTFGIGYRWEFKNRVNVRLDYGIGKSQTAFYFNINEAF